MSNKTILDFSEVNDPHLDDILYLIRGAGTDRDKKIKLERIIPHRIDVLSDQIVDLSAYSSSMLITVTGDAPLSLTLNGALTTPGGYVIVSNDSATSDVTVSGTAGVSATLVPGASLSAVSTGIAWSRVGTPWPLPGDSRGGFGFTALNHTDIAMYQELTGELRTYRYDGSSWAQVGNGLAIIGAALFSITRLNATDIAIASTHSPQLRRFRFDGTNWSLIGNWLWSIGSSSFVNIATIGENDIVLYEAQSPHMQAYHFDGADWAPVGSAITFTDGFWPAVTGHILNQVTLIHGTESILKRLQFNGSTWEQVGNGLPLSVANHPWGFAQVYGLAPLGGPDRIAYVDADNHELRTYGFDGSDFVQIGSGLALPSLIQTYIGALNDTDVILSDGDNDLTIYRFAGAMKLHSITTPYTRDLGAAADAATARTTLDVYSRAEVDANTVDLVSDQTVGGRKTFASIPVLPDANPTAGNEAARKQYVDDVDATSVKTSGNQTINGSKTFSNPIWAPSVNTGQGENELHPMDQAVRRTDDVQFRTVVPTTAGSRNASATTAGLGTPRTLPGPAYLFLELTTAAGTTGKLEIRGSDSVWRDYAVVPPSGSYSTFLYSDGSNMRVTSAGGSTTIRSIILS